MTAAATLSIDPILARARKRALELGEVMLGSMASLGSPACKFSWRPSRGLAGYAGLALAFMALHEATEDGRYAAAMHDALRAATQLDDEPRIGLFDGISGLRAAADLASAIEPRYQKIVGQCDAYVNERLPLRPVAAESFSTFDVIDGWAGIRLSRAARGTAEPDRTSGLLAWLCEDASRWRCVHPARSSASPENDLGMAHGIAGVLSALALTLGDLGGAREVAVAAAWQLLDCGRHNDGVVAWPASMQDAGESALRSAWCYGAPGSAIAIYQLARAAADVELEMCALDALIRIGKQPVSYGATEGQAICHGNAGVALIYASAAHASGVDALADAAMRTVSGLLDADARDGGRYVYVAPNGERFDYIDELNGAAGVALTLLTLAGACSSAWMRLHGLAPIT